jgi:hypothetical protein
MKSIPLMFALSAALLAGCAGGPAATKTDAPAAATASGSLEERAQKRWDLLVAGKAGEAWEFFSPGYRQLKSREEYAAEIAVRPVQWTKAIVQDSKCPEGTQVCDVTVEVHFSVQSTLPGVGKLESLSPIEERWIETEGSWYFVPKEVARN